MFIRLFSAAALFAAMVLPAQATTGIALIIANQDYDRVRDAQGASGVLQSVRRFEEMGFRVELATDLSTAAMQAAVSQLSLSLQDQPHERVVIVFSGHVVNAKHGTWLMGTEALPPTSGTVDQQGIRLQHILEIAGMRQGGAIVAVADYGFPVVNATGFSAGLPDAISVPQGVSMVQGSGPGVTDFLRSIATPGVNIGALARRRGNVQLEGFDPRFLSFLPADHVPEVDFDLAAWEAATEANSIDGYQAYLAAYPTGDYTLQARAELHALMNTPERIEASLNLSRNERRAIQRDLTILGYEPRGIDGIFGGGTRAAISVWQGANGQTQTGYLTRAHIFELAQQGAHRAAQLEAEAQARQQALERQDRLFWRDTGSGQDEAGLRTYLNRFPEGIFASVAHDRLEQIEANRRAAARARENAAWAQARNSDSVAGYRAYLNNFPQGDHAGQAQQRIQQLSGGAIPNALEIAAWALASSANTVQGYQSYLNAFPTGAFAAQARQRISDLSPEPEVPDSETPQEQEAALNLDRPNDDGVARWVFVERNLATVGFNPGAQDGTVTLRTRQAIRRFQRRNDLPATGFLNQQSVRMLRDQARAIRGN